MGVPCKMVRVDWSLGGCLLFGWLSGDPPSGGGSSPRRRSCPWNYSPRCIEAAPGGLRGCLGYPFPPGQTCCRDCSSPTSQDGCCASMGWPRGSVSVQAQKKDEAALCPPPWRSRKPHGSPWGHFLPTALPPAPHCGTRFWLLSVPRRALAPGQLLASRSLCASWDGGRSGHTVGSVPGGLLHPWGLQHSAEGNIWQGPSLAWGPQPFLHQNLPGSWSSSALTTYCG